MSVQVNFDLSNKTLLQRAGLLADIRKGRDTIGLSISQLPALADGAGATYYVNPVDGDDAAAGSEAAPWKNLHYAAAMAGSTDNIVLVGASATSPLRWEAPLLPAASLQAGVKLSAAQAAYIVKSINISHGDNVPVGAYNFDFNSWIDETTPSGWIKADTAGSIARVTGDTTTYALRFDRTGNLAISVYRYIYLQPSTEYTVTFRLYAAGTSGDVWLVIRNTASGTRYLQDDGTTWNTTGNTVVLDVVTGETGKWIEKSFTFTSDSYATPYYFQVAGAGTGLTTHDLITITPTTQPTFQWTLESGSTYSMPFGLASSVTALAKCTAAEWGLIGATGLERVPKDTSTPTAPAAGKWGFDSGSIYYTLATGEDIEDIHFEATPGSETAVVEIASANSVAAENIITVGGLYGFSMTGTSAGTVLQNCQAICPESSPFYMTDTSDTTIRKCRGIGSATSDGATIISGASAKVLSSWFEDNYDDGINGNTTGTCTFSLNVCKDNKDKDLTSSGIETQGSGTYYLYNNVLTGNQKGWHNMASGTYTAKGNIAYNNLDLNFNPAATGTLVADKNCSFGADDGVEFVDENLITTDPLFTDADNGDFTLQAGSPCIGAGVDVFADGDGDQYDAAGNIVWNDAYDLPDGHWIDGVDIGAYAYGGRNKVFLSLTIISGDGWPDWVVKLPLAPALIAVDDGTFYTGSVANEIDATDRASLTGDQFFFSERKGLGIYSEALTGTDLARADRYFETA